MRNLSHDFKTMLINPDKLLEYGFDENLTYEKILTHEFKATFSYENNELTSKVVDLEFNEEYALVDVTTPIGQYACEIKIKYEELIEDIINKCSKPEVFKNPQTKRLINYIEKKFDSELEFLWKKIPDNAIYRNNKNRKWFAILLIVEKSKIGIDGDGEIEIIDLKYLKDKLNLLIDNELFFKGYHMNKKHWISIPLDGRLNDEELFKYIDISYNLVDD